MNTLYSLNSHDIRSQLYPNKAGKKRPSPLDRWPQQFSMNRSELKMKIQPPSLPDQNNQRNCIKNIQHWPLFKASPLDIRMRISPGAIPRAVPPGIQACEHSHACHSAGRTWEHCGFGGIWGKHLYFQASLWETIKTPFVTEINVI